jgi:hypothetical protein
MQFYNNFMDLFHSYIFPPPYPRNKSIFSPMFSRTSAGREGGRGGEVTCFTFQRVKENSGGIARLFHHRDRKTQRKRERA